MSEEVVLLKLVCQRLHELNMDYMLTGSLAANLYAVPRMTRDIDIVLEMNHFDINKFCSKFQDDFYLVKTSIIDAIDRESMFNIIYNRSVMKVDFIIRKNQSYRNAEFQRRNQVSLDEMEISIVSPEDLIISKLFWAKDSLSNLQIRDVKNLLSSILNLDYKYLNHWVEKLGLQEIYEKARLNE